MNTLRRLKWAAPVAAAALAVAACSQPRWEDAPNPEVSNAVVGPDGKQPRFRFNALGGGSTIILVYPGTSTSKVHTIYNATYRHGQERPIECHQKGRIVSSHPEEGEAWRQSDDWYKLVGGGEAQFATGTYGDVVPPGAVVRECAPDPAVQ